VGWDSRGYYYQPRRVAGRPRRVYVGGGPAGELAAEADAEARAARDASRARARAARADLDALDAGPAALWAEARLLAAAALLAGGCHRTSSRQWRRRRS
jgi:hypothetical protein